MYYPLSGFLMLFTNILQNPQDSYVASDLELMNHVASLLTPMAPFVPFTATTSVQLFTELCRVGTKFVEKTKDMKKMKRGLETSESNNDKLNFRSSKPGTTNIPSISDMSSRTSNTMVSIVHQLCCPF